MCDFCFYHHHSTSWMFNDPSAYETWYSFISLLLLFFVFFLSFRNDVNTQLGVQKSPLDSTYRVQRLANRRNRNEKVFNNRYKTFIYIFSLFSCSSSSFAILLICVLCFWQFEWLSFDLLLMCFLSLRLYERDIIESSMIRISRAR